MVKNKVAPPFRIAEFDVIFGEGISSLGCLLDMAEETGIIVRKGAWYSYDGDNLGQGRDKTIEYMKENAAFAEDIDRQVRAKLEVGVEVSANTVGKESPVVAESPIEKAEAVEVEKPAEKKTAKAKSKK